MPAQVLDPLEALRLLTTRLYPKKPAAFPVDEAPEGFLSRGVDWALELVGPQPAGRRALRDGYAFFREAWKGDELRVLGVLTAGASLDLGGKPIPARSEPSADEGSVWRVETGAILPADVVAFLPVSSVTIVGPGRIRVGETAEAPGADRNGESLPGLRARFPAGTRLGARLRALLQSAGISQVELVPPFPVGFATVGDELMDLGALCEGGQRGEGEKAEHRPDLTAPDLETSIRRIGLTPVALGILPDSPTVLHDTVIRAKERRLEVVILAGGLGEGLADRTIEALKRVEADFIIQGLDLDGCSRFVFAKAYDLDILALGGLPFEAAAGMDLFVRPALCSRLGAPRSLWDWSRISWHCEPSGDLRRTGRTEGAWRLFPAAMVPDKAGAPKVRLRKALTPFHPTAEGQEGWAVVPPTASSEAEPTLVHFQPL